MSDGTRIPADREQQRLVWRRLRGTLAPRANWSQAIVGILCLLLGMTFAVQVSQDDDSLEGVSQQELVRLLDESGRHVSDLEVENAELDSTLRTLQSDDEGAVAAREAARKRLDDLEILAGTVPAQGRGVMVSIADPERAVKASTLLGVVQELRNAGAEVIQIGEVRVIASTSITTSPDGALLVDGVAIASPYTVLAIGDPAVMEPALRIPGGAADSVASDGGTLAVAAEEEIQIDAVVTPQEPEHARPVK